MVTAGDFRKGVTVEIDGNVFTIVDFLHVKPGKGSAFVRTKLKNVMTGAVLEKTFNPVEKFENATIEAKKMQYSYNDGGLYYFMDIESYEIIPLNKDQVDDALKYIRENDNAFIRFYKGSAFSVEPDTFVELLVTATEPGVKGNTATNATKPATVETGAVFYVPMFINEGDKIRIDTRSGEYMDRVK